MPRTKQRKVKAQVPAYDQVLRDFNRLVQLNISKKEIEMKDALFHIDTSIESMINRFPVEIQNMTMRELLTIEKTPPKKENILPTPRVLTIKKNLVKQMYNRNMSTVSKRTTATSDDGYQSESAASQASKILPSNITRPTRRTRSSSRDKTSSVRSMSQDRKSKLTASNVIGSAQKKVKKDMMKTPTSKQPQNSFVITPKIKLNSAINVLRKPKDGEMVFSTQGSPLLVSTTVNDRTANINVPLRNGNVVSLLPFNEHALSDNFHLDEETKHQLKILQSHLAKVLD